MPTPPLSPPADEFEKADSGSEGSFGFRSISAKLRAEYEDAVVEVDSLLLAPLLFDLDRALSSLLPSWPDFADRFVPILSGGSLPLAGGLPSCGIP